MDLCGAHKTRLYKIWDDMNFRCKDRNKKYCEKGISVCGEWKSFEPFYVWAMSHGYADNLTIDRIDCYGNYSPNNCRWTTIKEQQRNKTNNHVLCCNGIKKTMSEWSEITGIPQGTLYTRVSRCGWSDEKAVMTPSRSYKRSARLAGDTNGEEEKA